MSKTGYLLGGFAGGVLVAIAATSSIQKVPPQSCTHEATKFVCVEYLGNYDGDTLKVNIRDIHPLLGEKIGVRILGVDTPEMKGKGPCEKQMADEAREFVSKRLKAAGKIELRNIQRDKYFRILSEVWVDGVSLADQLIQRRLAYAYDGGTKEKVDWCEVRR